MPATARRTSAGDTEPGVERTEAERGDVSAYASELKQLDLDARAAWLGRRCV